MWIPREHTPHPQNLSSLSSPFSVPLMAASLHPSTAPIFTPFSSLQNRSLFSSSREEKRTQLSRGNSAPLSLVPFRGILPLKPRQKANFRTFIWYCKPHRGSEAQLFGLIETNNLEKGHVTREKMEGYLVKDCERGAATRENSDFVERDGEGDKISMGGYTKIATKNSTAPNTENLNSDSGMGPNCFWVGDYIKRIVNLPIGERVKVLDLLQCDNRSLTISDYNDILEALSLAEEFEHVIRLFSELKPNNIKPDSRSFSILVNCLCKKNDPLEAKRVLDEMLKCGFKPNKLNFTSVVQSLCKRGRVTMALEVFDKMRKASVDPMIYTYNSLIFGLCYVGRLEEALEVVSNLKVSPTKPDIYTYTVVIDGYCKVGMTDTAVELFKESKEMGLKPTKFTYNALLNGLCKESRTVEALSLLKEMQESGTMPDLISYNIVLRGLLRNREFSIAWKMFKRMREAGFQPGERSMNAVLRGLCRLSLTNKKVLKDVKELFKMIVELQFGPSTYTYCLMVQALASAGEVDSAVVHLHNLINTGASPRMLTFNMVIRVLCQEGRVYDALGIVVTMIEVGKMPSMFSFNIVLNEFCKQGKVFDALALYGAAVKRALNPEWKLKNEMKCKEDFDGALEKKERREEERIRKLLVCAE